MRHQLAAAVLAGVLMTASCGGGGSEGAESEIVGLEREPVDVLLTGTRPAEGSDDFHIDEVVWTRGAYRDADGALIIPTTLQPDSDVRLDTSALLAAGRRYVVVARQRPAEDGEPLLQAVGVLDHESNEMLQAFLPIPADLLLPGESGPAAELNALFELVRDSARFHAAIESPGPMSRRLARAMGLAVQRQGGAGVVLEEGMAIDDYLLLDASRRTLTTDLPVVVADTLGLTPLQARVVLPPGFADEHWGIGFWTSAGLVGPIVLEVGQKVVDVDGVRPRGSGLTLVAWEEPPSNAAERSGTSLAIGTETLQAELQVVRESTGEPRVLYVDVVAGTVSELEPEQVEALPPGTADG